MKARLGFLFMTAVLFAGASVAGDGTEPTGRTLNVNDIELAYEVFGDGQPLLLLHSGTQSGEMWEGFVVDLAARFKVIIPDLRGHGGSTNPEDVWSTRTFASDIRELLDHLGIDRFNAIGASAGGMTLLHMAIQEPDRVEAMVVIGVGTYLPSSCRGILAAVSTESLSEAGWEQLRARHHHGDEQIRALYAWVASLSEDETDMVFTPPMLAKITARTLVIHGDRDYCFPASMAWEIYDAIPEAYLWVVPNGGHVPISGPQAGPFLDNALEFLGGGWRSR
jgi:pimeloyl-ACP methyl ester carboxylesterase